MPYLPDAPRKRGPKPKPPAERFWPKVLISEGCWTWIGGVASTGYGTFGWSSGLNMSAHAAVWKMTRGEVPAGLELDHLCRNRRCVNPDHLEPVTHLENVRRGMAGEVNGARQRAKTHCAHGHEYTPENTYWVKRNDTRSGVSRQCKICCHEKYLRRKSRALLA